jgi:hypothetical protein
MEADGDDPPRFQADPYTPDQLAMLELLGNPEVVEQSSIALWYPEGTSEHGVPSIAPARVVDHPCPVVEVLGRRRAILPNGDLHSQS